MKNKSIIIGSVILLLLAVSCAPGNEEFVKDPAGFWVGFWHGIISVVTLIIGIFNSSVKIYEVNNVGWMYDLGFLLGVGFGFSNIWFTSSKTKKKKS